MRGEQPDDWARLRKQRLADQPRKFATICEVESEQLRCNQDFLSPGAFTQKLVRVRYKKTRRDENSEENKNVKSKKMNVSVRKYERSVEAIIKCSIFGL